MINWSTTHCVLLQDSKNSLADEDSFQYLNATEYAQEKLFLCFVVFKKDFLWRNFWNLNKLILQKLQWSVDTLEYFYRIQRLTDNGKVYLVRDHAHPSSLYAWGAFNWCHKRNVVIKHAWTTLFDIMKNKIIWHNITSGREILRVIDCLCI